MYHFGEIYERHRRAATPMGTVYHEEVIDIRTENGTRVGELCRSVGEQSWLAFDVWEHCRGLFDSVGQAESAVAENPDILTNAVSP